MNEINNMGVEPNSKRPDLNGLVNDGNDKTYPRIRLGRVSIWKNFETEKQPKLTGILEIGNKRYRLAIWENTK